MKTLCTGAAALLLTLATSSTSLALVNLGHFTGGSGGGGTIVIPPINIPSSFQIASRALQAGTSPFSDVGLSWIDNSEQDVSTIVERNANGGTWGTRKTFNAPLAGPQTYVDASLSPDITYCYRITTYGPNQQFVRTSPRCVLTQVRGDVPVWRTELRVRVANVPNAGTDRWVSVALTLPVNDLPGGNWTGINYAIDDFEAASDMTYDLSQTSITTLRDISRISLGISHWDDAVCLRDLQLKVNGQVAFMKTWGNTPSTCKWLGGSNGPQSILIDQTELRASATFAAFTTPRPSLVVPTDELASRLESTVGSLLFGSGELVWRDVDSGFGVQVTKKANVDNVLHVKLPLEGLVDGLPNPNIDIDFDLKVGFVQNGTQWELHLDPAYLNANADYAWWVEKLVSILDPVCVGVGFRPWPADIGARCIDRLASHFAASLSAGFSLTSQRIAVALPANCVKPSVSVAANGDLRFGCESSRRSIGGTAVGAVLAR